MLLKLEVVESAKVPEHTLVFVESLKNGYIEPYYAPPVRPATDASKVPVTKALLIPTWLETAIEPRVHDP